MVKDTLENKSVYVLVGIGSYTEGCETKNPV